MDKNNYISGLKAAEKLGLHISTLRKYADNGVIDSIKTHGGVRRYCIDRYLRENSSKKAIKTVEKINIAYCRVSSSGQKDDLMRQVEFMQERYPSFEIVTDIGSGINFDRPGLRKIIDCAIDGKLNSLAVAYKDRLCRIGYNLIEYLLKTYSAAEIIVANDKKENINEEMMNDLMMMLTVYTAKINGMRKYKRDNISSF